MLWFRRLFSFGYVGAVGLAGAFFFAVFLLVLFGATGCDTNKSHMPLAPVLEDGVTVLPAGAYIRTIEYEGGTVKAWVVDGRGPHGQPYKVIMVLDYPCGAVGPIPAGHGRDCTDTDTPSDEPPANPARWMGDPTADD